MGKEKKEKEKGESDFFVYIWHTLMLIIVYPLREKMVAWEKI